MDTVSRFLPETFYRGEGGGAKSIVMQSSIVFGTKFQEEEGKRL